MRAGTLATDVDVGGWSVWCGDARLLIGSRRSSRRLHTSCAPARALALIDRLVGRRDAEEGGGGRTGLGVAVFSRAGSPWCPSGALLALAAAAGAGRGGWYVEGGA